MIKRYSFYIDEYNSSIKEDSNGEYVKYEDYKALEEMFAEACALLEDLEERDSGEFHLPYCPCCEEYAPKHAEGCELRRVLNKARIVK